MTRFAVALAIVLSTGAACRPSGGANASGAQRDPPASSGSLALPAPLESRSVGFHSARQLTEHFEKHGNEFGRITEPEYLSRAQRLRDAPLGAAVVEAVRRDGVITRFDRSTGAFIAFDRDGTIRTFFRPNDGESYFRRQARR